MKVLKIPHGVPRGSSKDRLKGKAVSVLSPRQTSLERLEKQTLSDVKYKYYDTVEDNRRMEQQAKELRYHTQGLVRSARRQRSLSAKSVKHSLLRNYSSAVDLENKGLILNQQRSPSNRDLVRSPVCALRSRNENFIN